MTGRHRAVPARAPARRRHRRRAEPAGARVAVVVASTCSVVLLGAGALTVQAGAVSPAGEAGREPAASSAPAAAASDPTTAAASRPASDAESGTAAAAASGASSATISGTTDASLADAGGLQTPAVPVAPAPASPPVALDIPAIGVTSGLESLGTDAAGVLEPPEEWQSAGWYRDGVRPGDRGAAIVAGHVDSRTGPAVFARLAELAPGDEVAVTRADGSVVRFVVEGAVQSAKAEFPTDEVYGAVPDAQLRLITCGGAFDADTGHYTDNLIVFARAV